MKASVRFACERRRLFALLSKRSRLFASLAKRRRFFASLAKRRRLFVSFAPFQNFSKFPNKNLSVFDHTSKITLYSCLSSNTRSAHNLRFQMVCYSCCHTPVYLLHTRIPSTHMKSSKTFTNIRTYQAVSV